MEQKCAGCGEVKEADAFSREKNRSSGLAKECKECRAKIAKKWREDNPEKAKESQKKWREDNPEKMKTARKNWHNSNRAHVRKNSKSWHLMNLYGITLEDMDEMIEDQKGCCALCGEIFGTGKGESFCVDHDHSKEGREAVRGVIHARCNNLLGMCKDDVKILERAIKYLKKDE
jgi:hypothetical protein